MFLNESKVNGLVKLDAYAWNALIAITNVAKVVFVNISTEENFADVNIT